MVFNEHRLLGSSDFDSRNLLGSVLAGDALLGHKLQRDDLLPVGICLRIRLTMEYTDWDEWMA